jgi:branched-chain amino acid aminotransferase
MAGQSWSQTWTFYDGKWHEGNVPLWGVRTHAIWLGSSVFDGARVFEGVAPDIDQHCARVNASAKTMYLKPLVSVDEWLGLARDPESTRFALSLYDTPMRKPDGFSVTLSPFRRPTYENAPVDAKAGCLYPNNARAMFEAKSRGFDNCVVRDVAGNVAELANSNLFIGKDGVVMTPIPNGTFLAGITRKRVIGLLRDAGISVLETVMRYEDILAADEIFSTGNASKVLPITRIDDRPLQPGPLYRKARALYWEFAHSYTGSTSE